jgi:drug/metabolite transporter (DMT)-like permease
VSPFREQLKGIVLVVLSASLFAVVDGVSKILAETQTVGQIVWARYALALPVLVVTTRPSLWASLFRTGRPVLQAVRGVTPLAVSVSMVLAVRYLPLAEATVILFIAPFIVVALSGTVLGERVSAASWIGVTIGFAAVLLVARPGFGGFSAAVAFPLVAALFYALLQLVTRYLGTSGERADTTLAWTLASGGVVATPFAILSWGPTSPAAWALLLTLGIVFGLAQLLMIRAFTHASAGVLAPFSYAQIIAATIFGTAVFGAIPELWTFAGIAMIIFAGLLVIRSRPPA